MSNSINVIFIIIIILMSVYLYIIKSENSKLLSENESKEKTITILELQNSALNAAILKQNDETEKYKKDSESYKNMINKLNEELKRESQNEIIYDSMNNKNSTDKEAIEWLKSKRNSLSF